MLKLIPYYTGKKNLEEVMADKKSRDLLWLEILLNDDVDWENKLSDDDLKQSYDKACVWYGNFKTMLEHAVKRKSLQSKKGAINQKEYRKFIKAINFVAT